MQTQVLGIRLPVNFQNVPDNQATATTDTHRGATPMHLQSPHSGDQHHHVRAEARVPAFDVEKFFHANVCSKSCFSHCKTRRKSSVKMPADPSNPPTATEKPTLLMGSAEGSHQQSPRGPRA